MRWCEKPPQLKTERTIGAAAVRWPQYIDMIGDLGLDPNAIWPYLLQYCRGQVSALQKCHHVVRNSKRLQLVLN